MPTSMEFPLGYGEGHLGGSRKPLVAMLNGDMHHLPGVVLTLLQAHHDGC